MTPCIDRDVLVTLASAGADPVRLLTHAVECPSCRETLEAAAQLRAVLGAEATPRPGFTDEVMEAAGLGKVGRPAGPARRGLVWSAVNGVLATALTLAAVGVAGAAAPMNPGPLTLLAAATAGVGLFAWDARTGGATGPPPA